MTDEEFAGLRAEVAQRRVQRCQSKFGLIPASVEYLQSVLAGELSEDDRADVYTILVSECSKARNDQLYIDVLRHRAVDLANDPLSHIGLAFRLALMEPTCKREALDIADKALDLAKKQNRQIRFCATYLARIGLMIDDYVVLQRAIEELVADAGRERLEDTGYEFDFVDRIDIRRCDAGLLALYKALKQ